MGKIIQLDAQLTNQIAAGEVVERPVSVVKELVENSLDAGATFISVEIQKGGIDLIQISDNGEGIAKEDLEICLQKYTTSKIKNLEDLYHVMTFGFRGEALASISSVSKFTITSKTLDAQTAFCLTYDTMQGQNITPVSANTGTIICVENLFYNTPARLNYLKTEKTEYSKILDYLHAVALSHPEVGFEFVSDGKKIFQFAAKETLSTRLYHLYSQEVFSSLLPLESVSPGLKISGYISDPKVSYGNKNRQHLFINHRPVFSPLLAKSISDAYNRFIPHGTYPAYVLHIEIDPTVIDVNVHPRKQEVRFENEQNIFRNMYHCVFHTLEKVSLISGQDSQENTDTQTSPGFSHEHSHSPSIQKTQFSHPAYYTGSGTKFQSYSPYKDTTPNPNQSIIGESIEFTKNILQDTSANILSDENTGDLHYTKLGKIIGQAFFSYILVERDSKLVMLDQHALAERVIYEKLLHSQKTAQVQTLLIPETLKLTSQEYDLLTQHKSIFENLGFFTEELSHQMISLQSIPDFVKKQEAKEIFLGILGDIGAGNTQNFKSLDEVKNKIFAYTACRSAIKFGHKLNLFEMNKLLNESLESYSSTCPHGRPVIYEITLDELKNKYER